MTGPGKWVIQLLSCEEIASLYLTKRQGVVSNMLQMKEFSEINDQFSNFILLKISDFKKSSSFCISQG